MTDRMQDTLVRAALAVPLVWVAWDALRAVAGTVTVLLLVPASARALVSTVFLLAFGLVPALAMAGCVGLATALLWKYPRRPDAVSLALLTASLGLVFSQFFLPTLFADLVRFGTRVLPGLEALAGGADVFIFGFIVALAPAWLFWFSAAYPAGGRDPLRGSAAVRMLGTIQRRVFRSPAVLPAGMLPALLVVTETVGIVAVGLTTLAVALGSLWLSHRASVQPARGRTAVVMGALAMPILPLLLWPLADRLPAYTPFFQFDVSALATALSFCALVYGLAYAVFVQGAVGPALVVRRGLLGGAIGAAAMFVFAGLESVIGDFVLARFGLPGSIGTFLSAGALALAVQWVRRRTRQPVLRPAPAEAPPPTPLVP